MGGRGRSRKCAGTSGFCQTGIAPPLAENFSRSGSGSQVAKVIYHNNDKVVRSKADGCGARAL